MSERSRSLRHGIVIVGALVHEIEEYHKQVQYE